MTDKKPPPSLLDLGSRIARARARRQGEDRSRTGGQGSRPPMTGLGMAVRVGVDLVAGLIVGVAIGVLLDRWLGTGPWLLVVFFVLGAAAGFVNVYRTVRNLGMAAGYPRDRVGDGTENNDGPGDRDPGDENGDSGGCKSP
ncbi:MAG: AtpZ/AtpI family protein [Alphaproteobacteria bacterium]